MTVQQLLLILRARYKVILFALLTTVAATLAISTWLPKQYTATAAVVIDLKSPDMVSGLILQGMLAPAYLTTQVDIINSDRVAKVAAKLLRMQENAVANLTALETAPDKASQPDLLTRRLQKGLDAKPSRESNLININYTGADPDFAAAAANAFAQAYINVNLDLRVAPARQYATFFDEQVRSARARLEKTQLALTKYQQKNGIISADEGLDYETAKLNETSSLLTGVQGQTTDSQSKRQNAKADTVAEVMQSTLINSLKTDISRLESKLTESNVNLGKNHPQTLRSEAELATLKAQMEAETQKITSSIETTYQVSKQREQQLQSALASQKARVLLLNRQRDELNVLRRDLESAQSAFELVSQKASQTNIESQTNQTNIALLNPASAPTDPSRPRVLFNALVSVFLGLLLGMGGALVLELLNRRVRSSHDLVEALSLPVLGTIGCATGMLKHKTAGALT
jgi:polysaccharide biosynthesis transport protein